MKNSLIITVLNEEQTIWPFLRSIISQTVKPHEVIIVDGGSTDSTLSVIFNFQFSISYKKTKLKVFKKKGNRSIGRNYGIKQAKGDIILCSDAGCTLDKKWIENIIKPFRDKRVDVVAGYYSTKSKTVFQKCLVPYVLVMPDKIKPDSFLPATRSMSFTKKIWKKIGGFDERFSHNEDYVFAKKLEKTKANIVFEKKAVVCWMPRKNIKEAFVMFFRFALGDAESGIFRSKVLILFARYIFAAYMIFIMALYKSLIGLAILLIVFFLYILWTISKNYRYVKNKDAIIILPILQFTSDTAIILGTIIGVLKSIKYLNLFYVVKRNIFLLFTILTYVLIMVSTLNWGIPNNNHPFPYHMDEWHQLQAVRAIFKHGTPNIEGAANGTMFHFLLSGLYLVPFVLLKIVNPFAIASAVSSLDIQYQLFQILRLNTLFFGVLSVVVFYKIVKDHFEINPLFSTLLFTFSPIWLMLSGYFKYDIALLFWILISLYFLLLYSKNINKENYYIASFLCGLANAVKISALPLYPSLLITYFLFQPNKIKNKWMPIIGSGLFFITLFFFGMPDLLFGRGNILFYVYDNVILSPKSSSIFTLPYNNIFLFLFSQEYFILFGRILYGLFLFCFLMFLYLIKKELKTNTMMGKKYLFLFLTFCLFFASIIPLKILSSGNRALVLLPFMSFVCGIIVFKLLTYFSKYKKNLLIVLIVLSAAQFFESFLWVYLKLVPSSQEQSSHWIISNIQKNEVIGIENVPIYQSLPDIIVKEFYMKQYKINFTSRFKYRIVDTNTDQLPKYIVLSNDEFAMNYLTASPKKDLILRLHKEKFKRVITFTPDEVYFKYIGRDIHHYLAGLMASPMTISVYKKDL